MNSFLQPSKIPSDDLRKIRKLIPDAEPTLKGKTIIPVCEPDLRGNELRYVTDALKSKWISSAGPFVEKFEKQFAKFCGVKYAVSVTNGTHALHLALAALDIQPGDEVVVPTFTMIAVANAVRYCGATPVFVDAREDTWNMDETLIEKAISKKTKAIIVAHTYGHPVEMNAILKIAKKHSLPVIGDACEAHGAQYHKKMVGSLGTIGCFSFYANKMVSTGEGGMVVTNNAKLAQLMRTLHNHAFSEKIHFWHEYLGYNFRMTNVQAAIGCAQMERMNEMIRIRRKNARLYTKQLSSIPGLQLPVELPDCKNTYWMYGIVLSPKMRCTRDQLRAILADHGIETRTFFIPLHLQPIYFKRGALGKYPVAEKLCQYGLYLPSASTLSEKDCMKVCSVIRQSLRDA